MNYFQKILSNMKGDRAVWLIVISLALWSVMAVYSASANLAYQHTGGNTEYYLIKHGLMLVASLFVTFLCFRLHYMKYSKLAPFLLVIAVFLLLYTGLFGVDKNEARRWIQVPIFDISFQTSDFAKLALIIFVARSIAARQDKIKDFKGAFMPIILPIVLVCALIMPSDLSTAGLLFLTCIMMMIIGRIHLKYIVALCFVGVFVFSMIAMIGHMENDFVRVGTWTSRVTDFFSNPDGGYQIQQAKIAIASGELWGAGPGNSLQRSFLPYPYADFIYAIICEEFGLIGGLIIIGLYLWLFWRCTVIVTKSPKAFGALLAIGLGLNIVIQAFANIAVSVHLLPVTGLTLPFVSMGGTSVLFTSVAFGIILSVSRYIELARKRAMQEARVYESHH